MAITADKKTVKAPTTIRPKPELLVRIQKIAEVNGVSAAAVINLALAGGLNIVETKLAEIRDTPEVSATASTGDNR